VTALARRIATDQLSKEEKRSREIGSPHEIHRQQQPPSREKNTRGRTREELRLNDRLVLTGFEDFVLLVGEVELIRRSERSVCERRSDR